MRLLHKTGNHGNVFHVQHGGALNQGDFAGSGECAVKTGTIFIRRCGKSAVVECVGCNLPLCGEHAKPWGDDVGDAENAGKGSPQAGETGAAFGSLGDVATYYCPNCLSRLTGGTASDFGDADNWDGSLFIGGNFGWGNSPFAEEDYAAFDAVSDYDKDVHVGHGYDS